jgi:ABC-type dipeptide/oligopeptide/nickel transport system ATPase component
MISKIRLRPLNPIMRVGKQITEDMLINAQAQTPIRRPHLPRSSNTRKTKPYWLFRIEEAKKRLDDVLEGNHDKIIEIRENKTFTPTKRKQNC